MHFQALLDEYEVVEDSFVIDVPAPKMEGGTYPLKFRSFSSAGDAEGIKSQARAIAEKCLLFGDPKAEKCSIHGPIARKLPATREAASQIALLAVSYIGDEPVSFIDFVRLCSNQDLLQFLWGAWNQGQKTVYDKLVKAFIEESKKNSLANEGSSSQPSETLGAQKPSSKSTRTAEKPSSGSSSRSTKSNTRSR